ncbi:MAG: mercury methylation corrinoid protein HgcA [Desulfobacterales bacterium]|nr:mercury methylation corrinoid protein HgcA [Desulfobacterales bacterium]
MNEIDSTHSGCCKKPSHESIGIQIAARPNEAALQSDVCCGSPPDPASSCHEKPGYALLNFVETFVQTPAGPVPRVKTILQWRDHIGTIRARLGIQRARYKIAPGLYCIGKPDAQAPVLVTANYKLTFDALRKELQTISAWILVLDTRGINVWCAAGKELFSTTELVERVQQSDLKKIVSHNQLILPQLAATGVAAHQVKKAIGFKVIYGPVRALDIPTFLAAGLRSEPSMRQVTFSTFERVVLIPVELAHLPKPSFWILLVAFLISGIGSQVFSFSAAWARGLMLAVAYGTGIVAGAVVTPTLLPWIPGRSFAAKGAIIGGASAAFTAVLLRTELQFLSAVAFVLCTIAVSSYLAMNFTGSTPFTSPTGVEKEMRKAIPLQASALLVALAAWIGSAFVG